MAGNNFFINAIKPAVKDGLDNALKTAPQDIRKALASGAAWLPTTVDTATAAFKSTYTSAMTGLSAWLPKQEVALVGLVSKLGDWAKKKVDAL